MNEKSVKPTSYNQTLSEVQSHPFTQWILLVLLASISVFLLSCSKNKPSYQPPPQAIDDSDDDRIDDDRPIYADLNIQNSVRLYFYATHELEENGCEFQSRRDTTSERAKLQLAILCAKVRSKNQSSRQIEALENFIEYAEDEESTQNLPSHQVRILRVQAQLALHRLNRLKEKNDQVTDSDSDILDSIKDDPSNRQVREMARDLGRTNKDMRKILESNYSCDFQPSDDEPNEFECDLDLSDEEQVIVVEDLKNYRDSLREILSFNRNYPRVIESNAVRAIRSRQRAVSKQLEIQTLQLLDNFTEAYNSWLETESLLSENKFMSFELVNDDDQGISYYKSTTSRRAVQNAGLEAKIMLQDFIESSDEIIQLYRDATPAIEITVQHIKYKTDIARTLMKQVRRWVH